MRILYPIRLHPSEEEGFWAEFPDIPGCVTQGDTEEETLRIAQDALTGWLAVPFERNFSIPEPSRPICRWIRWVEPEPEVANPTIRQLAKVASANGKERVVEVV